MIIVYLKSHCDSQSAHSHRTTSRPLSPRRQVRMGSRSMRDVPCGSSRSNLTAPPPILHVASRRSRYGRENLKRERESVPRLGPCSDSSVPPSSASTPSSPSQRTCPLGSSYPRVQPPGRSLALNADGLRIPASPWLRHVWDGSTHLGVSLPTITALFYFLAAAGATRVCRRADVERLESAKVRAYFLINAYMLARRAVVLWSILVSPDTHPSPAQF
ncbi:hypothetical protein B0H10DRAFT_2222490 [Mycena sp. CBHHK59/15]|nr:hypothetical protein B0H10DRAFT_2222490 [Mycena sp. CBHHK59/15]